MKDSRRLKRMKGGEGGGGKLEKDERRRRRRRRIRKGSLTGISTSAHKRPAASIPSRTAGLSKRRRWVGEASKGRRGRRREGKSLSSPPRVRRRPGLIQRRLGQMRGECEARDQAWRRRRQAWRRRRHA
eukprot:747175-Hanusia_phi.AAC.12